MGHVLRLADPAQRDPGQFAGERAAGSASSGAVCGVAVMAGLTALTRMPCGPPSVTSW